MGSIVGGIADSVLVGGGSSVGWAVAFSSGTSPVGVGGMGDGKGVLTLPGVGVGVGLKDPRTPFASEQDSVTRQPMMRKVVSSFECDVCMIEKRSNHTTKSAKRMGFAGGIILMAVEIIGPAASRDNPFEGRMIKNFQE